MKQRTRIIVGLFVLLALGVAATGCPSSSSKKKPYVIEFTALPPSGTLVHETFDVAIQLTDKKTGLPIVPKKPLDVTIGIASGSGNLIGTTEILDLIGATALFSGLSYDTLGPVTFEVTSKQSPPAESTPVSFEAAIEATPDDLGGLAPGTTGVTVDFTLYDFNAATYAPGGQLVWEITDSTLAVADSGTVAFGGPTATVTIPSTLPQEVYLLTAHHEDATNEATSAFEVTTLYLIGEPGPYVALKSARVGASYSDSVAFVEPLATEYGFVTGTLPTGLNLDTINGTISGTPTVAGAYEFTLFARIGNPNAVPIRCSMAIFDSTESVIVPGQDFTVPGPWTIIQSSETFDFESSFDQTTYTTTLEIYHPDPALITTPLPLFVHHRGRGFHYQDYDNFLSRVASHGFICVSVEDFQSFYSPREPCPICQYDGPGPCCGSGLWEMGMGSGSAFQEGAIDHMLAMNRAPGGLLEGTIDEGRMLVGGHSRGGGATHASHHRWKDLRVNGALYFMAIDLRFFNAGLLQSRFGYPIGIDQPRLPSLVIAAERDPDVSFPFADQFTERATGPSTFATIYGGIHAYLGDSNVPLPWAMPYISRLQQQNLTIQQVVAFLKRWGELDLSVDGFLYGNELAGSPDVGMTSLRHLCESILVDDFQDVSTGQNVLGGSNSFVGGTRTETSFYPPVGSIPSTNPKANRLIFNATTATYSTDIPAGTDSSSTQRLIFRSAQTTGTGYDWMTWDVLIEDTSGQQATVRVFDRAAPSTAYLPDYLGSNQIYDRYVEVQIPYADFRADNPGIDTASLARIDFLFDFAVTPAASDLLFIDDLRLE